MRRKKLANQIMSVLLAGLMMVTTPMSALATDTVLTDSNQIEVQSTVPDDGAAEENAADGESTIQEDSAAESEEEILEEPEADNEISTEADGDLVEDYSAEEEQILGDEELYAGEGQEIVFGDSGEGTAVQSESQEGESEDTEKQAVSATVSYTAQADGAFLMYWWQYIRIYSEQILIRKMHLHI